MPRIARIIAVNYPHHMVQRGNNRQDIFFDDDDRDLYLYLLKKYTSENECRIHAYCLMSNHVHLLAVPLRSDSLAKTMQKVGLTYTQYFNKKFKRTGRLWECRFHSTVVDTDNYLLTACRYIERNPVRRNIAKTPIDYRWSSARINSLGEKDGFICPVWQAYVDREEYAKFLNLEDSKDDVERLRVFTLTGKPFGNEEFISNLASKFKLTINTRPKGRPRSEEKWDVSLF